MLYFIHKCPKWSLKSICREMSSSAFDFAWFLLIQRYTARASSDLSSEWYKVFRSPECLQFTLLGCLLLPSSGLLVLLIGNMQLMTYASLHSSSSHPSSTRCKPKRRKRNTFFIFRILKSFTWLHFCCCRLRSWGCRREVEEEDKVDCKTKVEKICKGDSHLDNWAERRQSWYC